MLQSNEGFVHFSPKSRKQNDKISNFQYSILGSTTPIFFFFPKLGKQEMCAWSEREEILGAICRREPNRALGQFCRRRPSRGLVQTRAQRLSQRSFAAAAPGDSLRAEVKPRSAARLPRAPPSPLSLPPLGGPLRGTGGALPDEPGGRGGVVYVLREKSSAAPEWRPRVINKLRFCPDATTAAGRRIGKA